MNENGKTLVEAMKLILTMPLRFNSSDMLPLSYQEVKDLVEYISQLEKDSKELEAIQENYMANDWFGVVSDPT